MWPRLVTKSIHAYLDYPVAIALMVMPFLLGLGQMNQMAVWLSVATGAAAFVMTLFTDHHLGAVHVLPYRWHRTVDLTVGVLFLAAPFLFGFSGLDALYYWANGAAVMIVVSLHKPEEILQPA